MVERLERMASSLLKVVATAHTQGSTQQLKQVRISFCKILGKTAAVVIDYESLGICISYNMDIPHDIPQKELSRREREREIV